MRQRKRFTHGMMVSYSKNSKYEDQELMLDSLLAECDDCDDDRPLIPPREPIVAMKLSPPPQRQKKSLNTHMWVTLPDKECLPSGEVASDGEVTGKFTQKSDFEQDAPQSPGSMPIKVFNEDNSSVTFSVGQNTTAMEACYKLMLLNAIKEDPTWVLVEHLTDLGIGEYVTDLYMGECVTDLGNGKCVMDLDIGEYMTDLGIGECVTDLGIGECVTDLGIGECVTNLYMDECVMDLAMGECVTDLGIVECVTDLYMGEYVTDLGVGECVTDLGIERNLEDHEKVIDVYNSLAGNSKLLFRKDPTKYDFFTNTAKYADTKLFEDGNTEDKAVSEKARKAKKILLMNLLSKCTRVPEISDVLHIKDYTKKSWTKKFIILRGSGLYTSHKGKSKAFKDLQSFAQFDGNNLYTMLNANKSHKAPTNFAFSLAYGPQLRQNYDDMLRKFAILARLEPLPPVMDTPPRPVPTESQPVNQDSLPSDRVAMDFTGTRGKLVTNCKEIEELTKRQKPQLSRRLSANHFISNSSSTGKELAEEFWFHGRISHDEALVLMKREGFEDGLFLVRESCSVSDVYVLTFCMNKKVFHCQLVQDIGPGSKMYYRLDKGPAFPSILELIRYYQRKTVNGISVALGRPCTVKRRRNFSCV
ncbi:predicted protein [Nematostella vectensis]|uniref:SH2 domain-containing protein n=1 Tax=Nematostella vectensis TaxID=45351 RepID=A7S295_NEMVE|nr:predicted protein [Nematostella vectensis]|eukprot:XP_001634309.1 predicted protein [Nematostella vectensis]